MERESKFLEKCKKEEEEEAEKVNWDLTKGEDRRGTKIRKREKRNWRIQPMESTPK